MNAALIVAFATLARGATPEPVQLIHKAMEVRKTQDDRKWKFTWREEAEMRDEKGRPLKPFHRTWDVIMLEGESYRKLVLIDGQPLDDAMQKKVDADIAKERELRRKHAFLNKAVPFGGLGVLERLFDNKVVGEEMVGGRKAWKVESERKHGAKAASPNEEEILATRRTTWFDEEEGAELRRRAVYVRGIHSIKAGSFDELEWSKVGDAWLLATNYMHTWVSPAPGFNSFGDVHYRYMDYKRFSVESTFTPN
jgi:hypothetical protein